MSIALLFALALTQANPAETGQAPSSSPEDAMAGGASNLPKDDYGLVAWCHGALAGQLELDPIAHADMVSIEGKAKVAARAKSDAEMEKDRREYLHQYERALAAAEKASPVAIHQYGVESELSGYKLWGATRQKQPIWRMLDWGMWDPNDAGCGEAAKRLFNRASLFGEALKGQNDAKEDDAKDEPLPPAFSAHDAGAPVSESAPSSSLAAETLAPAAVTETPAVPASDGPVAETTPAPKAPAARAKSIKLRTAKVARPRTTRVEAARAPEATGPVPDPTATTPPEADKAAPPADQLRGPQA